MLAVSTRRGDFGFIAVGVVLMLIGAVFIRWEWIGADSGCVVGGLGLAFAATGFWIMADGISNLSKD